MDVEVIKFDADFGDDFDLNDQLIRALEDRLGRAEVGTSDALRNFDPRADDEQTAVIRESAKTIRVLAPAGSGKTQTMINRVLSLVKAGVRPERILVLTFDNAAARALMDKLAETSAAAFVQQNQIRITTLNAFGYRLLGEYFPDERKDIIERRRALRLFRELKDELAKKGIEQHQALPTAIENRFYLDFFGLLKNAKFDPRAVNTQALVDHILQMKQAVVYFEPGQDNQTRKLILQAIVWLFKNMEVLYQREKLMDFDDQKLRPLVKLSDNKRILSTLRSKFDHVLVDEFQDINLLDFDLIQMIAADAVLMVTGDDDQAIYGFRGCTPEYIIRFQEKIGRPVASHELRVNYRCPRNIVQKAAKLIEHNEFRVPKKPIAHREEEATIKVVSSSAAPVEARLIVRYLTKIKNKNDELRYSDFAVLYRTNAQSLPIQLQFILSRIPYFVREEDNILRNDSLARLLGVLRIKLAVDDDRPTKPDDALLAIRAYFQFVKDAEIQALDRIFRARTNFFDAITSDSVSRAMPKIGQSRFVQAMREVVAAKSLMAALDLLAKNFKGLRGMIGSLEDVVDDKVPLGEVYELASSFRGKVRDFVATLDDALREAKESDAGNDRANGVALLTYFRAKGLQWHTVILTSCNQGLIPHKRAPIEDERRLFYVAMTRASCNLFVSFLKKACKSPVAASQFLQEADLLEQ